MLERQILDLASSSLAGSLQSENTSGSLHAQAADFGSRNPFIGVGAYILRIYSRGLYMLERPTWDLAIQSLGEPTIWESTI